MDSFYSIELIDAISDPCGFQNEDIYGLMPNSAWVVDGATGLGNRQLISQISDAKAFVNKVDGVFREIAKNTDCSLELLIESAVREVRRCFAEQLTAKHAKHHERPSATVALVLLRGAFIEYGLLGDCRVLFKQGTRVVSTETDNRLAEVEKQLLHDIRVLHQQGITEFKAVHKLMIDKFRRIRAKMNTPNGYWVLGFAEKVSAHLRSGRWEIRPGVRLLLVSDGFYRLVDTFRAYSPATLMEAAETIGLQRLLSELRRREKADKCGTRFLRLKQHDDATAVLLGVKPTPEKNLKS